MPGEYPYNWNDIAAIVKEDAGWQCQTCHTQYDEFCGPLLGVHHIDGDKSNCTKWNLVALCRKCHLRVQPRPYSLQLPLLDPPLWLIQYFDALQSISSHLKQESFTTAPL